MVRAAPLVRQVQSAPLVQLELRVKLAQKVQPVQPARLVLRVLLAQRV